MDKEFSLNANLLVDEEEVFRQLDGILSDLEFDVSNYSDPDNLQQSIRDNAVQLVVVDRQFIGDIFGFLEWVMRVSVSTRVIILSRRDNIQLALNWVNQGGFAFYTFPVDYKKFREKIRGLSSFHKNQQFLLRTHRSLSEKLKEDSRELATEAKYDDLTGLAEKDHFERRTEELLKYHRAKNLPLSLLIFDIDHFKKFNDTQGHPAGDEALSVLAELAESEVRDRDLVARVGGEEFAVALPRADTILAVKIAERLRDKIDSHVFPGEQTLPDGSLTISVGVSTFPDHARDFERLIELADRATYRSKSRGRNCVTKNILHTFKYEPTELSDFDELYVVGEFNNWTRGGEKLKQRDPKLWEATLPVPAGTLTYAYSPDGEQLVPDPGARQTKRKSDGRTVSRTTAG